MQQIHDDFLVELYKASLTSKSILDIVVKHLKYHFIPQESYKLLFQKIVQQYELNSETPTIGSLSQHFHNNEDVLKLLQKVRNSNITDKKDILLDTFEKFLVARMFVDLYVKIGTLHNEGKQDKAIELLEKESAKIANFSIRDNYYTKVFQDFKTRQVERELKSKEIQNVKVPFSIHCLDHATRGGINLGTSALVMAMSGRGKTTFLRWVGVSAARLGFKVVHFQQEGTEEECLTAYDSAWTSINVEDMEFGLMPKAKEKQIEKVNSDIIANGGEIFVRASDTFDSLSINDCKEILDDIERVHGKIHLVIFDYLEIFSVSGQYYNSEQGERKRREDIANKITSIATSSNVATLTATQANDIRPEKWNNPDFVLTRSDISEFKGALKPFSYFVTINQTADEYDNGIIRLHEDKYRKYKSGKTYKIAQSLENGRFYDSKKSLSLFWDDQLNKSK